MKGGKNERRSALDFGRNRCYFVSGVRTGVFLFCQQEEGDEKTRTGLPDILLHGDGVADSRSAFHVCQRRGFQRPLRDGPDILLNGPRQQRQMERFETSDPQGEDGVVRCDGRGRDHRGGACVVQIRFCVTGRVLFTSFSNRFF